MKRVLVTGGAGFIGSNFVRHLLRTDQSVIVTNLDKLTYAGNMENLRDVAKEPRHRFQKGDICDRAMVLRLFRENSIDTVVHFAAESHVDRSILESSAFMRTNIVGTHVLLDVAKEVGVDLFVQVSTDEVYGSLSEGGAFSESTPLHPNSPYAASKASADLLALAYHHTFQLPVIITRCSNNYGPFQFPEKLIPLMIVNAMQDKSLPVYGDGLQVRDWIFVEDHCLAIDAVIRRGRVGEVYNIGGDAELKNIDVVRLILKSLEKPESLVEHVKDRPGHDRHYAMDFSKLTREVGWKPIRSFESGLAETIEWYGRNQAWCGHVMSGEYLEYYRRQYEVI